MTGSSDGGGLQVEWVGGWWSVAGGSSLCSVTYKAEFWKERKKALASKRKVLFIKPCGHARTQ